MRRSVITSTLGVLSMKLLVVDLLLHFDSCRVEGAVFVGNGLLADVAIVEVHVHSIFMEAGMLVRQSTLEARRVGGQVLLDSLIVELVVLGFQSPHIVLFLRQVSRGLLLAASAHSISVVGALLVGERFSHVAGVMEVLAHSELVILVPFVSKSSLVRGMVL
jgi:hypothetical protein